MAQIACYWCLYASQGGWDDLQSGLYLTQLLVRSVALIQAIFLNLPANVSAAWFPSQERDISTMFASISGPLGNALGSSMPAMFVNSTDSPSELDNHMALLLLIQFTMCLGVFLPTRFLSKAHRPPRRPRARGLKRLAEDERERLVAGVENFGLKVEEDRKLTITSDDDRSGSQSGSRRSGGASNRLGSVLSHRPWRLCRRATTALRSQIQV